MFGSKIPAALSLPRGFYDAPKKPKFFGQGGTGRAILGSIGDALLQSNNMGPIYAPAMAEQRAMQMAEQNYQRQLRDSLSLYRGRKQIDAELDPPESPYAKFADLARLPEDERNAILQGADYITPIFTDVWTPDGIVRQRQSRVPPPVYSDEDIMRLTGGSSGNTGGGFR